MKLPRVAAWSAAGALGLGLLAGVALAGPSSGSGTPDTVQDISLQAAEAMEAPADATEATEQTPGTEATPGHGKARKWGHIRGALRRIEHGEFVARTKDGHVTFHVQRGTITAVSATSMTVRSEDGFTETWTINGDTKIRRERKDATAGALKVGDWVRAVGPKSSGGATARHIRALTEPPQRIKN